MKDTIDKITQKCGDIEQRIKACRTRDIAISLQKRLCDELGDACPSDTVRIQLEQQVGIIINKVFDQNGHNKYLEA